MHGNAVTDALTYWGPESNYRLRQILTTSGSNIWQHLKYATAADEPGYQANGLLTADRQPKIPLDRIAEAVRGNLPVPLGFIG